MNEIEKSDIEIPEKIEVLWTPEIEILGTSDISISTEKCVIYNTDAPEIHNRVANYDISMYHAIQNIDGKSFVVVKSLLCPKTRNPKRATGMKIKCYEIKGLDEIYKMNIQKPRNSQPGL
jgi:hypothetical protein